MARNLIMGTYYCSLNHSHSSNDEVSQCNRMEEERQKREHELHHDNLANAEKERDLERQKHELEMERLKQESEVRRMAHESEERKHREKMAELETEKLRLEKQKAKATQSRICEIS